MWVWCANICLCRVSGVGLVGMCIVCSMLCMGGCVSVLPVRNVSVMWVWC